jgi:hypothetical protein
VRAATISTAARLSVVALAPARSIVKLNTTGAEFFGIEWTNRTATALICTDCGFVHEFLGDSLELYDT